jgi:hypothetical protein
MLRTRFLQALATSALLAVSAGAATAQILDSASVAGLKWRNVGPANFMGRVSDVQGIPGPSKTLFVAAAAGGVWKTMNNGITWRPVFDDKRVASLGMLAIAPSDTQQVWLGTGEPNSRNSIEPGAGIYKSNDGGMTWTFKGLEKTQHIGRVIVHPTNPNIVYVAALGAAWKANPERGIYKTTDGGTNWQLIKFINDKTGFVDIAMDPRNPNTLFASAWQRVRTPYSLTSGGPGSGLFKTTDGGTTWTEVKGGGFPDGNKGRIGLAIAPSNPNVVYALTEAAAPQADGGFTPSRNPPGTGLYRSADGGATWTKMNSIDTRPFYYSQVRVDPKNPDRVYFSSTQLQVSDDGGRTSRNAAQDVHVDSHAIWIDPNDPERWVLGNDGGVAFTFDKGGNFIQMQNLPIPQFYEVSYDFAVPYNICGGAQDNGAWCGPSKRRSGTTSLAYWFTISGGDGFYTAQDPKDPNIVYGESQGGNASRINLKTGERQNFERPSWQAQYRIWEDSIAVLRGDPLRPATPAVNAAIAALRTMQKKDSLDLQLRFNWNTPYFLSPHNPAVIYYAGNHVLKSLKRGESFYSISPDLSKQMTARIDTSENLTGGITIDATGAETYGTVVTLAESPIKPGLLLAGTDDGNLWITRNDGANWTELSGKLPGLPAKDIYVSRVEASHFDPQTFYVALENHRWNDFTPYVFVTTDGGNTFRSIANDLPKDGPGDFLHVIREDPRNRDVLFVGSSVAVYASIDRGAHWTRFMTGAPTVPFYDLQIHPRDRDLIAATHGRGFWIVDIAPIEQLSTKTMAAGAYLFEPKTAFQWGEAPSLLASGNGNAQGFFATQNPPYGATISYRIQGPGAANASIRVVDAVGDTIYSTTGPGAAGLHTVNWNFQGQRPPVVTVAQLSPSERRDSILRAVRAPMVLDSLTKANYDTASLARARQLLTPGGGANLAANFGRGAGGGGGRGGNAGCERPLTQWDSFCARPGEAIGGGRGGGGGGGAAGGEAVAGAAGGSTTVVTGQVAGRGAGGRGAAGGGAAGGRGGRGAAAGTAVVAVDPVQRIFEIIGLPMPGGGGGRGGRGGGGGGGGRGGGGGGFTATTGDYSVVLIVGGQTVRQRLRVENVGAGDAGSPFGPAGKADK